MNCPIKVPDEMATAPKTREVTWASSIKSHPLEVIPNDPQQVRFKLHECVGDETPRSSKLQAEHGIRKT